MTLFWHGSVEHAACPAAVIRRDLPQRPRSPTSSPLPPQALADDVSLILTMKERYDTPGSPVVALGGSLAGTPALHLLP